MDQVMRESTQSSGARVFGAEIIAQLVACNTQYCSLSPHLVMQFASLCTDKALSVACNISRDLSHVQLVFSHFNAVLRSVTVVFQ